MTRALIIDDNPLDAALVARELRAFHTLHVDTREALAKALENGDHWDVVLTDHAMPQMDSGYVLGRVRAAGLNAPVLIVSGQIGESALADAMHAGIAGYVPKDRLARLPGAIDRALKVQADALARDALERDRRLFFELSTDLFAITDLDGRFRMMNRAWRETLGRNEEELASQGLRGLVHPDDRAATREAMARLGRGEPVRGFRNRVKGADGKLRWLVWNATPEIERNTIHMVARDVTAQVAADEAARQEERYAALGVLVSGVAHEINNPLTYVLGNVDLIRLTLPPEAPDDVRGPLDGIERGARKIGAIVEQLRRLARPLGARPGPVDVDALAQRVLARANEEGLDGKIASELGAKFLVVADEGEIEQILTWLLRNARDATRETAAPRIRLTTREANGFVEISVEDNGYGITPAEAEKLFLPFFTTKPEGVGLALAVSRSIAEARGGSLRYEPTPGGGATFVLSLPREGATPTR